MVKRPWDLIKWQKPYEFAQGIAKPTEFSELVSVPTPTIARSLRDALNTCGSPYVPGASPLGEAQTLLAAGAEVEHGLLAEYLYNSWSLGANPTGPRIRDIAVQEMCHLITVQNLLLFAGSTPHLERQDQAPNSAFDPRWFVGKDKSWSARIGVLIDFAVGRGHREPTLGRDYGLLTELAHPTRSAAENSVTLCGVRMGIPGAEDQILAEQENCEKRITATLYRLLWLILDQDVKFIAIPLNQDNMPVSSEFVRNYEYIDPLT